VKLQQRFLDMHHSLLRNSAEASAGAVLDVIGRKR
jgi:lipid-A-disaccharide synthase